MDFLFFYKLKYYNCTSSTNLTTISVLNYIIQCNHTYRIYSNKRRGAYYIFRALSAALIRGRRLFEGGAYLKFGRHKESYLLQLLKRASFDCQYLSLAET